MNVGFAKKSQASNLTHHWQTLSLTPGGRNGMGGLSCDTLFRTLLLYSLLWSMSTGCVTSLPITPTPRMQRLPLRCGTPHDPASSALIGTQQTLTGTRTSAFFHLPSHSFLHQQGCVSHSLWFYFSHTPSFWGRGQPSVSITPMTTTY